MLRGIREQPEENPLLAPHQIIQERQRITCLPLYFQGYLSACHSRCHYLQKLDTSVLTSATNIYPDENGSSQFILILSNGELELKANDWECSKEWKGFICTVTKVNKVLNPSDLPNQSC
ncbi:signal-transducing adaptor protein 1 [Chlamydotis macqueenii]